ncbi:sigma factor G inhibitor Gin [Clostridium sp.]|uniref:sigma factor G inhibitor Gin n=1 Tax=Clostridium sp. TaxID=1506 RepID=UPI003F381F88
MNIKSKEINNVDEKNICIICRKEKYDGIIIGRSLVCNTCHEKILNTTVDNVEYEFYKNKVKKALLTSFNIF